MSFETILLLVLFVIVPLLQQLFSRRRDGGTPEPGEQPRRPYRPPLRRPQPANAPLPPWQEVPPFLPEELSELPGALTAPTRAPIPDAPGPLMPAPRPVPRTAGVSLRDPRDLRRSIVLMTILGPCRAANPYDMAEPAGHR